MELPAHLQEQWAKREAEDQTAIRAEARERAALLAVGNRKARRAMASKKR